MNTPNRGPGVPRGPVSSDGSPDETKPAELTKEQKLALFDAHAALAAKEAEAEAKLNAVREEKQKAANEIFEKLGGGPWTYKGTKLSCRKSRGGGYYLRTESEDAEQIG